MTITYKWKVLQNGLMTKSQDGKTDVVVRVMYSVEAEKDGHVVSLNDAVELSLDPRGSFTPFSELTEETVVGWVKAVSPTKNDLFERSLANMLDRKINPPVLPVAKQPPWTCTQA